MVNIYMWILHQVPDSWIGWIINTVLTAGVLTTVAGWLVTFVPVVNTYRIPVQITGILLLITGVYFKGGYSTELIWQQRVHELQEKLAQAQQQSKQTNIQIVNRLVTETKVIHDQAQDIVNYVDREVVRNQEVVKFVENCPVPDIIITAHNAAARNQPIEQNK